MSEEKIKEAARKIVEDIEADISDRRGLKSEWRAIDPGIQEEIREEWAALAEKRIREALGEEEGNG
jgi:hypothetical protein